MECQKKKQKAMEHLDEKQEPEKTLLPAEVLTMFANAMAFETVSDSPSGKLFNANSATHFVEIYIEGFTPLPAMVKDDCPLILCPGPCSSHSHIVMVSKGTRACSECKKQYCHICITDNGFCLPCLTGDEDTDPITKLSEQQL